MESDFDDLQNKYDAIGDPSPFLPVFLFIILYLILRCGVDDRRVQEQSTWEYPKLSTD